MQMQILQAFKFELRPDGLQQRRMRCFAGSRRFVFNKALELQKENYENGRGFINYYEMCKKLTAWRNSKETPWLRKSSAETQQQAFKDVDRAYKNFFEKHAAFPKFKYRGDGDNFRFPSAKHFKLDEANGRVYLPKLGWMRLRLSRKVLGELKNATVSYRAGKWFVSFQTQRYIEKPVPVSTEETGIDVGIKRKATLANGDFHEPLKNLEKHEKRLAHYQKLMSRKVKGSRNWSKVKLKVQRLHARIANCRNDYNHKITIITTR